MANPVPLLSEVGKPETRREFLIKSSRFGHGQKGAIGVLSVAP